MSELLKQKINTTKDKFWYNDIVFTMVVNQYPGFTRQVAGQIFDGQRTLFQARLGSPGYFKSHSLRSLQCHP